MKPDLTLDWWRPDAPALPVVRQRAVVKLPGRFAFAAIAAYTVVLVAAPQEFVAPLRPLRLALVFALLGVMAHLADRALQALAATTTGRGAARSLDLAGRRHRCAALPAGLPQAPAHRRLHQLLGPPLQQRSRLPVGHRE